MDNGSINPVSNCVTPTLHGVRKMRLGFLLVQAAEIRLEWRLLPGFRSQNSVHDTL